MTVAPTTDKTTERGFGLPEMIIVIVFMLFASFVGMRIYEAYLKTNINTTSADVLNRS